MRRLAEKNTSKGYLYWYVDLIGSMIKIKILRPYMGKVNIHVIYLIMPFICRFHLCWAIVYNKHDKII